MRRNITPLFIAKKKKNTKESKNLKVHDIWNKFTTQRITSHEITNLEIDRSFRISRIWIGIIYIE